MSLSALSAYQCRRGEVQFADWREEEGDIWGWSSSIIIRGVLAGAKKGYESGGDIWTFFLLWL